MFRFAIPSSTDFPNPLSEHLTSTIPSSSNSPSGELPKKKCILSINKPHGATLTFFNSSNLLMAFFSLDLPWFIAAVVISGE